ncbi:MAG: AI-2E family transporter [Sideroxydans sp.]|nr:AI-2E family transporter [Sideroxydans sp.]
MTLERFAALQWFAIAVVFAWLIYLLAPILTPFVAAAILAYVCAPLVNRLCRWQWPRTLAVLAVMVVLFSLLMLLVLLLLPMLQHEIQAFMARLPQLIDAVQLRLVPYVQQHFGISLQWDSEAVQDLLLSHWQNAGGMAGKVLPWLGGSSAALLGMLVNLVLMPVVLFYLLRDWPTLLQRIEEIVPRQWHAKVMQIVGEVDSVLAEFLRGQISVMLLMSSFYVCGLWFAGLQFALPIGVVAGMLVFIPYIGMITGLTLATLAAFTQFTSFGSVLLVWAVFFAGQLLEGMAVTPWLVGERIGLHPLAVIFALLAFGQLFGFFGVLLALPLSAMLLVGLRHAQEWYLSSRLYQE